MNNQPEQIFRWQDYLAPKFWSSWIGLGFMRLIALFPYRLQLASGKLIGYLFYKLAPAYRSEIALVNIRMCFPELSAQQQQNLVRENFYSLGISLVETAMSWWSSDKKLRSLVKIKGYEIVEQALSAGKGGILLGAHYSTVEISGRLISLDYKIAASYHPFKNPLFNQLTLYFRKRTTDRIFDRNEIRQTFRYIKQNNLMWIASDQDANIEQSIFVPFFGHPASTQTVPSRMAKVTGAPVIPYISRRLDNAQGYEIEFFPALENFPGKSVEEDITRTNKILEEMIKKAPEQYFWVHRRFKTRPEGMPSVYPDKYKK
ncbi:MAG: lipid A biosynthesis lauroyl acyltransferase [Pseudomonadota bacterium]